jgi:hypothetical protein
MDEKEVKKRVESHFSNAIERVIIEGWLFCLFGVVIIFSVSCLIYAFSITCGFNNAIILYILKISCAIIGIHSLLFLILSLGGGFRD